MPDSLTDILGAPELAPPAAQPTPQAAPAPAGLPSLGTGPGYVTQDAITAAAQAAGIDPDLYTRVIRQESGGKIGALSSAGAIGPAQLMAPTAADLGVDPHDPIQNLQGGARYLRQMLDRYGGDQTRGLAAYNAGPDAVDKAGGIPNIPETRAYVAAIQGGASAPQLANVLGLTAEEQKGLAPYTAAAPTTAAGQQPGTGQRFNFGPNFQHMPLAAETTFGKIADDPKRGIDPTAPLGSPKLPYYAAPGTVVPVTPGVHWVDADGNEHVNGGGALENAQATAEGYGQGAGADFAASAARLGLGQGDPMMGALAQTQGGPSALENYQAANQAFQQQGRDYAIRHLGDPYAQTGRFFGQGTDAALTSIAVPEVELPGAALTGAGRLATLGGKVATSALRGAAATAPSVGANPNIPVTTQLGVGALTGVVAPPLLEAGGKAGMAAAGAGGWGRTVSPEVAALADTAQTKYGIQLRSGQVMGADGDRNAAIADSNMLGSNAKAAANNDAQRQAWMKGVTGTYGDTSGDVSPDALTAARTRIGGVMNDVASRSSIDADAVQTKVGDIIADAQKVLPDNEVAPLLKLAENIGSVREGGRISGDAYQALTRTGAPLDRLIQSADPNVSHYASMIRDALDDGLQASAAPEDVAALQKARFQYKNLMTVARLAPKAGVDGVISPALLRGAVTTNFKNAAFQGAGDLGELAQIGQTFMKEPSTSNTAARANDLLSGLRDAASAAGLTELGMAAVHQPENFVPSALAALAGGTARAAGQALKNSRIAGPATGIIQRSLPSTPGTVSALGGLGEVRKSLEVPLSALASVRGLGAFGPTPAVVGANAQ